MGEMAAKITKTLRLPDELWTAIEAEAEQHHRSVNGQIEKILKDRYVKDVITASEPPVELQARIEKLEDVVRRAGLREEVKEAVEQTSYLMNDPGGANAGTTRKSAKIRQDITDAKSHAAKKLAR